MPYVALRSHSHYSLLDGTMPVDEIVQAAVEFGMPAVGLVDRDTVAGAVQFYKKARAAGIHPVIGSEVTIEGGGTLVLLVENAEGYSNLCRLLTTRIEHPDGVTVDDLNLFRAGLICLCGAEGPAYREIYGPNFAFEISPHNAEDLRRARSLAALGRRLRIPVVATAHAHYRAPEDRLFYDILASMRTLTMLSQAHPEKHGAGAFHLHPPRKMKRLLRDLPRLRRARLAERAAKRGCSHIRGTQRV